MNIESKIKGALYGFVIGDAMGATTEFRDENYIKEHYGQVCDIIGGGVFNLPPGHGTDDTAMMLCVCEAISYGYNHEFGGTRQWSYSQYSTNQEAMLNRCCDNFISWLVNDGLGCGRCCYEAITSNLRSNDYKTWIMKNEENKNIPAHKRRLGNGSLMRTLPIALLGQSEDLAMLQGRLTHNNIVCDAAIDIYCKNINKLIFESEFHSTTEELVEPEGHVIKTLNNSIYWAEHTTSFEDAIIGAVNHGGDADTIAAITGSLVGALYGYEAIPQRWIDQLSSDVKNELDKYAKLFEKINKKVCTNTK